MCGLIGYSGNKPADPNIIKLLMLYNMDRGEDSTGWAINNKIKKDTEKVSKFLRTNDLVISEEDINYTIIAHARKSSSGARNNKELAHPFGIYKNGTEKENYDLVLAMNGTLTNTALMAEAFDQEYKEYTNSDTQIMAKAMANLGDKEYIKVIESYDGTATLLFFTPKYPNTLMVYRDPQRTLYCWQKEKDVMYISSMDEALEAAGAKKEDIAFFESENLYRIVKGKITKKDKVIRTPLKPKVKNIGYNEHGYRRDLYYESENFSLPNYAKKNNKENMLLSRVDDKSLHSNRSHNVYLVSDKYYRNGHPLQGPYYITPTGKVKDEKDALNNQAKKYFFIHGYMCKTEGDYDKLVKKCSNENNVWDLKKFKSILLSENVRHFAYPIITIVNEKEQWMLNPEYAEKAKPGQTITLDMFLSFEIYILKYHGLWIPTTNVEVCELQNIVKKSTAVDLFIDDVEKLKQRSTDYDLIIVLRNILKSNEIKTCEALYSRVKLVLKVNTSQSLREYFFELFFKLIKTEEIANSDIIKNLTETGKRAFFSSLDFLGEVDKLLSLINLKYKDPIKNVTSIDEKIERRDCPFEEYTDQQVIESICKSNIYVNNTKFKQDLYDAEHNTFIDFMDLWIKSSEESEIKTFCEGVLLCLNTVSRISDEDLISCIYKKTGNDIRIAAETHYIAWKQMCDRQTQAVKEVQGLINPEEVVLDTDWTPEEYETDVRENIQSSMDFLQELVDTHLALDNKSVTEWTKEAIYEVNCSLSFLRRKLFKEENIKK